MLAGSQVLVGPQVLEKKERFGLMKRERIGIQIEERTERTMERRSGREPDGSCTRKVRERERTRSRCGQGVVQVITLVFVRLSDGLGKTC